MPLRGKLGMARLRWVATLALVVLALSASPAGAVPTSAYSGQAEQSLQAGSTALAVPGAGAGLRGSGGADHGGLPFSAFDLLLIFGGCALILVSGAGFGRLLAERQRIGHP
jgi:hypothetical protein